ncbi:MAG: hypothetical protein JJT93_12425 [Gammaproteobacteria bacterium]|nr:hypothetical protein [Gammaproteobacteria bacterium]TVQ43891.1 MAG: hypothetical protein EA371_14390 [Gammaproteobacteria bacterium]
MRSLRIVLAWGAASLLTAVLAALVEAQRAMSALAGLGVNIGLPERLQASLHNLVAFAPLFALIAALALLLALPVGGALARRAPAWRGALHALAGFTAILAALGLMGLVLPVTPVSAARELAGLLALAACGGAGGLLFAVLSPPRPPE